MTQFDAAKNQTRMSNQYDFLGINGENEESREQIMMRGQMDAKARNIGGHENQSFGGAYQDYQGEENIRGSILKAHGEDNYFSYTSESP